MCNRYNVLFSAVIFVISLMNSNSQNDINLANALEALMINDTETAAKYSSNISDYEKRNIFNWHVETFLNGIKDSITLDIELNDKKPKETKVLNLLKNAEIYKFSYFQKDSIIYEHLTKAIKFSEEIENSSLIRFSYYKLLKHLLSNAELFDLLISHAEKFKPYIQTTQDEAIYAYYKYTAIARLTRKSQIEHYEKVLGKFDSSTNYLTKGILNQIIGISAAFFEGDYQRGIIYLEKAQENYKRVPGYTGRLYLFKLNNNLGYIYKNQKKYNLALKQYKAASELNLGKNNLLSEAKLYLSVSGVFEKTKQYDSALHYAKKEKQTIKKFNEYENAIKQREIETKYQTAEKEKLLLQKDNELLIEQKKKRNNRNLLIASLTLLLFGGITAFLLNKNTKRKQLLAEQGKALQTQKVATLLKEQELTAIDAMIEGQEKERQIIANDLHDDLGGLMATVKLHFDALQKKQSTEMFTKTNSLLEEAYQKIRGIAHAKNSGVLASQGLLKAINNMAEKVSSSNHLNIEVLDHGLENRLENSLELTIFRITQELIANTIKHANATEVTIQITNHDHKLNIIVEDNGCGFDTKKISKSSGMGIHSIDKRIENLGGTVLIDSEIGQGTSVIIDIPT